MRQFGHPHKGFSFGPSLLVLFLCPYEAWVWRWNQTVCCKPIFLLGGFLNFQVLKSHKCHKCCSYPICPSFSSCEFHTTNKISKKSSPSPLAVASNIIYHRRRWSRWLCDTKIEPPFASLPRRGRSQPWCLRIEAAKPGACFMGLSHMTYRKTIWKAPEKPVNWCWVYTFFRWFYMSKNDVSGEEAATHRKL